MRNLRVRFRNCERFSLGGNDNIVLEPKTTVQMILGTNGSGKSSLSSMGYTPYPPSHTDFSEGGFWEYSCDHEGAYYSLSADMDRRKYSFLRDDVELNESMNISTQIQLTEEHFGIDKQLNDILTGNVDFVNMSTGQRSAIIPRISKVDFSFAFSKYMAWKREYNSSTSVVKYISGRITSESEKLLSDEDVQLLRKNATELTTALDNLMSLDRSIVQLAPYELDAKKTYLNEQVVRFNQLSSDFLKTEYPDTRGMGEEELSNFRAVLISNMNKVDTSLQLVASELDKISNLKGNIESTVEGANIEDLENRILHLQTLIDDIPQKNIDIPDEWLTKADNVIAELSQHVCLLSSNPEEDTKEAAGLRSKIDDTVSKLNRAKNGLVNLEDRLTYLTSIHPIQCPKCNHGFRPGVDEEEVNKLTTQKSKGEEYLVKQGSLLDDMNNLLNPFRETENALLNCHSLRDKGYQSAKGLFTYIDSLGGFSRGRELLPYLSIYQREVECREKRRSLQEALDHATLTVFTAKGKMGDYDKIIREHAELTDKWESVHSELTEVRMELSKFDLVRSDLSDFVKKYTSALETFDLIKQTVIEILGSVYMDAVEAEISRTQNTLAVNVTALSNNELVEAIVDDLEKQLVKAKLEQKAYKLLVATMDPKTGFIAEQIKLQIGTIVDGMNKIIEKIWSYPLKILMPGNDDGKLDYKFPILVNGKRRNDISEGSSSMKVIVNSTFSILAHYSLGLEGYNVHLDEFDGTFDGAHTENVIGIIRELAESGKFGHVIVVSHDDKVQQAFPTADTVILDTRNLEGGSLDGV